MLLKNHSTIDSLSLQAAGQSDSENRAAAHRSRDRGRHFPNDHQVGAEIRRRRLYLQDHQRVWGQAVRGEAAGQR